MRIMTRVEQAVLAFLVFFVALGAYFAYVDEAFFRDTYTVEDGFTEWCTFLALFAAFVLCARRLLTLWSTRSPRFLFIVGFLALFCFFGAGEEISWGQRIVGFESPEFFLDNNSQQEAGIHNLEITIGDKSYKLNRIVFGRGLAIMFFIYLAVMTPLYRRVPAVTSFIDGFGIPMPRNYQIVAYLFVVAVAELLIDSSKRGEITEFGGSLVFMLNVIYPQNSAIFRSAESTSADK